MRLSLAATIVIYMSASVVLAQNARTPDPADAPPDCSDETGSRVVTDARCGDQRVPFFGSIYLGEVIDTFAGSETLRYLNPEAANESTIRAVGGVDFQYRLLGRRDGYHQVWVYGETIHGIRSRDVQCNDPNNVELSVCRNNLSQEAINNIRAGRTTDQFVAILRGATSLEAFVGVRYEFPPPLQGSTESPARLYGKIEFGFLTVAGGGGDVVDLHQIALGAGAINGMFRDSYLQFGIGQNDLFLHDRRQRLKIDGYLSIDPYYLPLVSAVVQGPGSRISPFIQFIGDFDAGRESDSIQTYFGLNFNFGRKATTIAPTTQQKSDEPAAARTPASTR